jgi:hypothetical protein
VEEKRAIVMDIVGFMQVSGRPFLKEIRSSGCGARWIPLTKEATRQKVAHALQYRQRCSVQKQRQEVSAAISVATPSPKGKRVYRRRSDKPITFETMQRGTDDQATAMPCTSTRTTGIIAEMALHSGVSPLHCPPPSALTSGSRNNDCAGSEVSISDLDDSMSVNEWEDLLTDLNEDDKLEQLSTEHMMDHNEDDEICLADEMLIELESSGDDFPFLEGDTVSVSPVLSLKFEEV